MNKIKKVEKEIEKILAKSPVKVDPIHSKTTKEWVLKLKPSADDALQIAALAHDIERGLMSKNDAKLKEKIEDYDEHKKEHSKRSAKIICDILRKYNFDDFFIKKVEHLVILHETGGDEESGILRDADSISFFEDNLESFFERHSEEKTKFKIRYMYDRISEKAKKIVKNFKYKDAKLNKLFREIITN